VTSADRLQAELNRLADELRQEQENYKNAESLRKSLEVEIREITVRLEEAEAFAQREGKRLVAKLQARLRDLEAEFEAEQRRSRDLQATNRKLERMLTEIRVQAEDDRRLVIELQDQVATLSMRVKTLRRQLEEAEEVVTITMNKYRKAQQMCEEAEHRADALERNVTIVRAGPRGRGTRSMSVTREITRVMKV
jgi:chromosome segregation ATPase